MRRALKSQFGPFAALLLVFAVIRAVTSYAGVNNPPKYFPLTNVYKTSQTVTCPPTATYADVTVVGAGGGGGGSSATVGGGGGGSGALVEGTFPCSAGNITLVIGAAAPAQATGGACSQGPPASDTTATQLGITLTAHAGANGIAAGCGGGAAGTAAVSVGASYYLLVNGNAGSAGTTGFPGPPGSGPNPGAWGGQPGLSSFPSLAGYAIVTFF